VLLVPFLALLILHIGLPPLSRLLRRV
jgi:hypothetical protein